MRAPISIVSHSKGISIRSTDLPFGKGFVFPYGEIKGERGSLDTSVQEEPEKRDEVARRIDDLGLRRPSLTAIFQIYCFLATLPEEISRNFISLLANYPIFAFDPLAFEPQARRLSYAGHSLDKMIQCPSVEFDTRIPANDLARSKPLLDMLGPEGIKYAQRFVSFLGESFETEPSDTKEQIEEKFLAAFLTGSSNPFQNYIQIKEVSTLVAHDHNPKQRDWLKGYPYVSIESSGCGNFAFYGGQDRLDINFDFWPPEDEGSKYGYTFGIID